MRGALVTCIVWMFVSGVLFPSQLAAQDSSPAGAAQGLEEIQEVPAVPDTGTQDDVYRNYRDPESVLLPVFGDEAESSDDIRLILGIGGAGLGAGGIICTILGFSALLGQANLSPDLGTINAGVVGAAGGMLLAALGASLAGYALGP